MQILDIPPQKELEHFLDICKEVGLDTVIIKEVALQTILHLKGGSSSRGQTEILQKLQNRWYTALESGKEPDWEVYAADEYLAELWACWTVYSRGSLRRLRTPKSMENGGILAKLGEVNRVADLGCGIGKTTGALQEIFPEADVFGTNIPDTIQARICNIFAELYGFRMVWNISDVKGPVDLVFASEYFEHFQAPLDHLAEVLKIFSPRAMLVANAFGAKAIGHFDEYSVCGHSLSGNKTSRVFAAMMRDAGYVKQKTTLWNNRPAFWLRSRDQKKGFTFFTQSSLQANSN